MTIENLREGMRVPNYRKLCEILEEPIKGGNAKIAQVKEFERYFSYEKEGNVYRITQIFEKPQACKDGRFRYLQLIEPILLHHLSFCNEARDTKTWSGWYKDLGMVNPKFYEKEECKYVLRNYGANSYTLYRLKNIAGNKMKEILFSALKNMKKRGLIEYKEYWYIVRKDGWGNEASKSQEEHIETVHNMVMAELGYENMASVYLSPKKCEAFQARAHELFAKRHGWRNVFKLVEIKALIKNEYTDIDENALKIALNKKICKTVEEMARQEAFRTMDKGWEQQEETAGEKEPKRFSLPKGFFVDVNIFVEDLMKF